eukprot:4119177-Amphidinium_carterae.2
MKCCSHQLCYWHGATPVRHCGLQVYEGQHTLLRKLLYPCERKEQGCKPTQRSNLLLALKTWHQLATLATARRAFAILWKFNYGY